MLNLAMYPGHIVHTHVRIIVRKLAITATTGPAYVRPTGENGSRIVCPANVALNSTAVTHTPANKHGASACDRPAENGSRLVCPANVALNCAAVAHYWQHQPTRPQAPVELSPGVSYSPAASACTKRRCSSAITLPCSWLREYQTYAGNADSHYDYVPMCFLILRWCQRS